MKKHLTPATKYNVVYVILGIVSIVAVASTIWAVSSSRHANNLARQNNTTNHGSTDPSVSLEEHGITPLSIAQASNNPTTAEQLAYLIEEEKLAHDVYVAMYQAWGSRVFNNIKDSETTHQGLVLAVMQSRGLADPRSDKLGVFANLELQSLYDKLVSQGRQSAAEAYKVGVAIEELDISDLKKISASLDPKDADIKDVLDNLLQGSENHLRAFKRQASR